MWERGGKSKTGSENGSIEELGGRGGVEEEQERGVRGSGAVKQWELGMLGRGGGGGGALQKCGS